MRDTISYWGLEFDRRPVRAVSDRGTPFTRWVPFGMPRIPDKFLETVFYLYPSEADAKAGRNAGGTGFLASLESKARPDLQFIFAVTNWHVACRGSSVVRLMRKDGTPEIFPYGPEDWFFDPNGSDIAITPISASADYLKKAFVSIDGPFEAHETLSPIGIGDDVFMIGRFVDHDGDEINRPTVRFGNISMMPAPIMQENGNKRDAYCIDMHSRSGYSGSPVFVYRTVGTDISKNIEKPNEIDLGYSNLLMPLGVHIGQFSEIWKIKGRKVRAIPAESAELNATEEHIEGLSGMTCVVPLSDVRKLLELPKLKAHIDRLEAHLAAQKPEPTLKPEVAESERPATPIEGDDQHKERFTALLDAAVGKPKQDG